MFLKLTGAVVVAACFAALTSAPASADLLCKEKPAGGGVQCPAGQSIALGAAIVAQTGEAEFGWGAITVKCTSKIKAETVENLGVGKGIKAKLTELSLSSCTGCSMPPVAENLPYKMFLQSTGLETGTVDFNPWELGGNPQFKFPSCSFQMCIYGAAAISFEFKASTGGGKAAFIEIVKAQTLMKQAGSGEFCPGTGEWRKAKYEVSQPLPVWIAKE